MAFLLARMDVGLSTPLEHKVMKTGEAAELGQAMKVHTDGSLTKCAATDQPEYFTAGTAKAGGTVSVVKVQPYLVFETTLDTTAAASAAVGKTVTLDATATKVTGTDTSGVARIVEMDGPAAAGTVVRVRF